MIKELSVDNVSLPVGKKITLLVGENNVGKFQFIKELLVNRFQEVDGDATQAQTDFVKIFDKRTTSVSKGADGTWYLDENQTIPIDFEYKAYESLIEIGSSFCIKPAIRPLLGHDLHHSLLEEVWELIHDYILSTGLQFVAETQSYDVVRSLANLIELQELADDDVTLIRLEKDLEKSVTFKSNEIVVAVRNNIEVR